MTYHSFHEPSNLHATNHSHFGAARPMSHLDAPFSSRQNKILSCWCHAHSVARTSSAAENAAKRGMTIIELMIAITLTVVIISLMVYAFRNASEEMSRGRAEMEMHTQLRPVLETLRQDLQNATCQPRPRGIAEQPSGYFELVEGTAEFDDSYATEIHNFLGDSDDVLALTVRSHERPFRGRWNNTSIESYYAEIIWWVNYTDANGNALVDSNDKFELFRRVLLIRPDLVQSDIGSDLDTFLQDNDVSVRLDTSNGTPGTDLLLSNSIETLALRENRFAHNQVAIPPAFPFPFDSDLASSFATSDHRMLQDVAAFDIRVFSSTLDVGAISGQAIVPSDYMYDLVADPEKVLGAGGYVDMGSLGLTISPTAIGFQFGPELKSGLTTPTFCTWTSSYESDGVDNDGDVPEMIDEGTNGIDDGGGPGVDDIGEREALPPYPYAVRSLQITVRIVDRKTKQVLQKTLRESFLPK